MTDIELAQMVVKDYLFASDAHQVAQKYLDAQVEIERLRGAIEKIANWNSVEVDEEGSEVALVNKVMEMRNIARQALEGVIADE